MQKLLYIKVFEFLRKIFGGGIDGKVFSLRKGRYIRLQCFPLPQKN